MPNELSGCRLSQFFQSCCSIGSAGESCRSGYKLCHLRSLIHITLNNRETGDRFDQKEKTRNGKSGPARLFGQRKEGAGNY
jgi:hypothetical protein